MKAIVTYALTNLLLVFAIITAEDAPAADWPISINQHVIAAPGDSVYLVQKGDTYYSLSRRFNIPLDSLQKWNDNKLQIGQTLYLSRHRMAPAQAAKPKSQSAPKSSKAAPATTTTTTTRPAGSNSASISSVPRTAEHKTKSRVMVIPFDPYLYFSDADDEIARKSKIPRQNVRHVFRNRLNAMLAPEGYETIHLLGGVYRDSVSELSRLYKSLSYGYQDNKQSRFNKQPVVEEEKGGALEWVQRQKEKLGMEKEEQPVSVAQDPTKHFGVTVKDPEFFGYFNNQYGIDYYVFINQFEVKTVYENCLDRAALNYERDFMVHYSIYNNKGELVSGNKVKIAYQSNMNDVQRIVSDNMPTMAKRVLSDLPPSGK
ncbi:LysM peptidoglycan-binding domain-containing protein [Pontibacter cellulosilyticus]|uniref:LysM peptidoglycan-binding domain-containing protein n=1 Tax=Pontibacter cellulosilyticus TaxID=1720253 RepID=A0A923SNF9_9BACT|nr:LysM domain-containing protein [Pontibacter cellulosilyticus]MBC5993160.1 LysM peptidoglycan-binding domain-containing protein [Pontibacter cellulosilyticus]